MLMEKHNFVKVHTIISCSSPYIFVMRETRNQCPYQVSTSYTLRFPRYSPNTIFKLKVTTARPNVKTRSDHDVAHLHPQTNVATKYQLPTLYGFLDTARVTTDF